MSEDSHPGSIEFEPLEQQLYALIEVGQATLLRSLALPDGYLLLSFTAELFI